MATNADIPALMAHLAKALVDKAAAAAPAATPEATPAA